MEPSESITAIEQSLRALVRTQLPDWQAVAKPQLIELLRARQAEEQKRRAPFSIPQDLLSYSHLYELRGLMERRWEQFSSSLGKLKEFQVWADQIEDFRNAPAHARELLPYERTLLEGLAGMIRAKVVTFRSSKDPAMMHYPLIEFATDSYGHEIEGLGEQQISAIVDTQLTLRPGDEVTFRARAADAQGRALSWMVHTGARQAIAIGEGSEFTVTIPITEDHVAMSVYFYIEVTSSGRYHRHTYFDHSVTFRYRVDPPDEGPGLGSA